MSNAGLMAKLQWAMGRIEVLERQVRHLAGATKQSLPCPECGQAKLRRRNAVPVKDSEGKQIGKEVHYVCIACKHEMQDHLPTR